MILTALLSPALSIAPALLPPLPGDENLAPPSTVLLKSAQTYIGSKPKDIEDLIESDPEAETFVRALDAETPQWREKIDDFFLMVTHTTNEQYRVFVEQTGHRPPFTWGGKAVDDARQAFLEAEHEKGEALKAEGKKYERKQFDPESWWSANWKDAKWEVPDEDLLRPVTHVDHADALAYCRWVGMRLPTELEHQRAVRGTSRNMYPWGEAWEAGRCATVDLKINEPLHVGALPGGVSPDGIYDLAGNVWAWTTSRYEPFPDFKPNKYKVGRGATRREFEPEPKWDGNRRVMVGGCFQTPDITARATIRRGTERVQMTDSAGFRCAATPKVGVDVARAILDGDVKNSEARGDGVQYLPEAVIAMDRWEQQETARGKVPSGYEVPEGYAVISAYEFAVFVPVEKLDFTTDLDLTNASLVEPVHLGFLSTNQTMLEPALAPGTYLLAYRAKGKPKAVAVDADAEPAEGDAAGAAEPLSVEDDPLLSQIDIKQDNFLLFDALTAELVHAFEATSLEGFSRGEPGGSFELVDKKIWEEVEGEPVQKIEKRLRLTIGVASSSRARPLKLTLDFKPDPALASKRWRHSR